MGTALILMGLVTLGAFIAQLVCYNSYILGKKD